MKNKVNRMLIFVLLFINLDYLLIYAQKSVNTNLRVSLSCRIDITGCKG